MESPPRQPRTLTTEMTFSGAVPQHTPLQKLVAGFGEIAPLPIPYARMPRRLGAYAQEFPRWSDVANQTPQALLSWPKVGDAAVRALVQAAPTLTNVTVPSAQRDPMANRNR